MTATTTDVRTEIEAFGAAYAYDVSYLLQLLECSPGAFGAFRAAQGMSRYRAALPLEAHFVARITAMQVEDCGPCLNLNLKMAREAGLDRQLLHTLVETPDELPPPLQDVRLHTMAALRNEVDDADRMERIRQHYGSAAFAEMAVVITGCRIYPTLKRALGMADYCELTQVDF